MIHSLQSQHFSSDFPFALDHLKNVLHDNKYRFVLYVISHNATMKRFFYSHARMAREMNCSVSTIKRWLTDLKRLGLIRVRSSAYLRTNIYTVNECYLRNKHLFYSKYKNFISPSLLVVSKLALRANELLLRVKELLLGNSYITYLEPTVKQVFALQKKESEMLQLNREQCEERSSYPRWAQDKALAIYNRKVSAGAAIINHANFFMAILRGEAARKQPMAPHQAPKEKREPAKYQPRQRPSSGPFSVPAGKKRVPHEQEKLRLISEIANWEKNIRNFGSKEDPYHLLPLALKCLEQEIEALQELEKQNENSIHAVTKPIEAIATYNSSDIMSTNYLSTTQDYQSYDDDIVWEEV